MSLVQLQNLELKRKLEALTQQCAEIVELKRRLVAMERQREYAIA